MYNYFSAKHIFLSLCFFCTAPVFARELPNVKVNLNVVDENMSPIVGATIKGTFSKESMSDSKLASLFKGPQRSESNTECLSDVSGSCFFNAPLTFDSIYTFGLSGALSITTSNTTIKTGRIWMHIDKDFVNEIVDIKIFVSGDTARTGQYRKTPNAAQISSKIEQSDSSDAESIVLDTKAAQELWKPKSEYASTNDHYGIRAMINKKTREVHYSLYNHVCEFGQRDSYRFHDVVFKISGKEIVTAINNKTGRGPDENGYKCFTDDVEFSIEESVLRAQLEGYVDGSDSQFTYVLYGADKESLKALDTIGSSYIQKIPTFEIAGLILRVDNFQKDIKK